MPHLAVAILLTSTAVLLPLTAQEDQATVRLHGRTIIRVGPTSDMGASARARRIERRLEQLIETSPSPPPANILKGENESNRVVAVAGVPIMTVTQNDAEENITDIDALARQWARQIDSELQRSARERWSGWSARVISVEAAFRAAFGRLSESVARVVPGALAAVLVLAIFWALATGLRLVLRLLTSHTVRDKTAASLIRQLGYYAVWIIGVFVAAGALGFEPETVVTGLGLTSLALGFALKDILSNFVSGMLLLLLRPFELGDQIVLGSTEGSVERIELRATQIRTYDGRIVYIPNAEIFTSRLMNNTAAPVRRAAVTLPLGYDQDLKNAISAFIAASERTAGVLQDPPPAVRVRELGPDDILLDVNFWTDSRRSDFSATTSAVRQALVEEAKRSGIGLPEPNVRAILPKDPETWKSLQLMNRPDTSSDGSRTEHE